ncbi:DUF4232 domain-containing protein [Dactylosporangium sp. NPDC051541]|uniref:DUF4232 domain-containing protein n=1 Tax=Dactylosporangium sp. NPDC051541 TaxID=3363977 RepID=UPI0037941ECE
MRCSNRYPSIYAPGSGAAGNCFEWLVFTNVSTKSCTLHGFPAVSWVTGDRASGSTTPRHA